MKKCSNCKIDKDIENFGKSSNSKDGYRYVCRDCRKIERLKNKDSDKEYRKEYYLKNKDTIDGKNKEWYQLNKDHKSQYDKNNYLRIRDKKSDYYKIWSENNHQKIRDYKNRYYKEVIILDPLKKLKFTVSQSIRRSFKNKSIIKNIFTKDILKCDIAYFKLYLESKFEPWMTWENQGLYNGELNYGWDIDHIIPISIAETEEDVIILNHYTNLQPLCSKVNRDIKRNKITYDNQEV